MIVYVMKNQNILGIVCLRMRDRISLANDPIRFTNDRILSANDRIFSVKIVYFQL